MTQNNKILEYMRTHNGITTFDAFAKLRITRLSGRIHELRHSGHNISLVWEESESGARYGRYLLNER